MNLILTHVSGRSFTMPWRPEGRESYTNTAASFLYNLNRTDRADWTVEVEGRIIPIGKACTAAAAEMNAIRNGQRIPPLPQF